MAKLWDHLDLGEHLHKALGHSGIVSLDRTQDLSLLHLLLKPYEDMKSLSPSKKGKLFEKITRNGNGNSDVKENNNHSYALLLLVL